MGSNVRLFLTPWLPPVLFTITLVVTFFSPTEVFSETVRFSYTIPFHLIALALYVLGFVFIYNEESWKKAVVGIVNFSLSFYIWVALIAFVTEDWGGF